jgi:CP family cyanate transporter-like MFS transporter
MSESSRPLTALLLLWLAGNALRLPILAIPPVLALIQSDLRLSGT